ncbi:MAG TPA: pilus assembly protein PilM [Syntrophales bacterium]|nr:pilus assembly protein PilM [Syntrophales bacterium]HPQ44856.1 pilus assembly protein PilM [Syntrophales bacterium]
MLFQTGLGVSIEKECLSVVYLKASFREVKLEAHAVYQLPADKALEERLTVARNMIREFLEKNHILSTDIYLSVPRDLAVLRYIELPLAVKENLRETLGYEMEKYVPFSADDVYFDCRIISEDREAGTLKMLLVAAAKDAVGPYTGLCQDLGTGISGIEISSTALTGYFSHGTVTGQAGSAAILYMAGGRIELNLVRNNLLLYSRYVEAGGDMSDLSAVVRHELELLHEDLNNEEEKPPVIFCGPPVDETFFTDPDGESLFEIQRLNFPDGRISSHELIPAYGCALKAIQKTPMNINLLPVGLRKKPSRAGYYAMLILGGLLILSLLSWGGGMIVRERLTLERLDTRIGQLSAQVAGVGEMRAQCNELEKQIDYLINLGGNRIPVLDVLRELSDIIPQSAWINSFYVSGDDVRIEGYAELASELIPLLEGSPLFGDVAFVSTITKTKDGKEKFRIGLKVKGGESR